MKYILQLIFLALLVSSCSTHQATVKKHEKLQYESVRVHPDWKYKNPKGKKLIMPVIGLAAGGVYGYKTEFEYEGKVYKDKENAAIWGAVGLLGGLLINSVLFSKRGKKRFDMSQSNSWLNSYNKTKGQNFLIKDKEMNNTLVLVPREKVEILRSNYKKLLRDLESSTPSTSYSALQTWRQDLKAEYSILPPSEINLVANTLSENEQKVANQTLRGAIAKIKRLSNTGTSLKKISQLKSNHKAALAAVTNYTRTDWERAINNKANQILRITLVEDERKLDNLPLRLGNLPSLNSMYEDLQRRYQDFQTASVLEQLLTQIGEVKSQILKNNATLLQDQISQANTANDVERLRNLWLSKPAPNRDLTYSLGRLLDYRSKAINEEIAAAKRREKERLARIEKERQLAATRAIQKAGILSSETAGLSQPSGGYTFNIKGLQQEKLYFNIYVGNFEAIDFNPDGGEFVTLFSHFLRSYGRSCRGSLPRGATQITDRECATERVTTNGWGVETNRICIEWMDIATGLYAHPEAYAALNAAESRVAGNTLQILFQMLKNPTAMFNSTINYATAYKSDMTQLVNQNKCGGEGLLRFQENLRRFALNATPLLLEGMKTEVSSETIDHTQQNLQKLANDLIAKDAQSWAINRFHRGTTRIMDSKMDGQGQLAEIKASYNFEGWGGNSRNSVRIVFNNGRATCMYFADFPSKCKTPDRKIMGRFYRGEYAK